MVRASGQRAVRFEQFALQSDQAIRTGLGRNLSSCGQIPNHQGMSQQLGWEIGQLRVIAGDELLRRGNHTGVRGKLAPWQW